jgi:hypothetical protein
VPVPLIVTDEPPDPWVVVTVEWVGAAGGGEAGGVLLDGGDAAVLWVAAVALCAGLLLAFLTGWRWTVSLAGAGTVAIEATVALPC